MEDLGVARGYIDLDLGQMTKSIATAVDELDRIDRAAKTTDSQIALLQSTSTKTGSAFEESAKQAAQLANKLETAKGKVEVYEREIGTLKTQLEAGKTAQEALARAVESTRGKYDAAKKAVEELDAKYKASREDLARVKQTHAENAAALKEAEQASKRTAKEMASLAKESSSYTREIEKLEKAQAGVAKQQETTNKKLATAKTNYVTAKKAVEDLDFKLTNAKADLYKMEKQFGTTAGATKQAREAVEKYERELAEAEETLREYRDKLDEAGKKHDEAKQKYKELGDSIEAAKQKYKEAGEASDKLAKSQGDTASKLEEARKAYEKSGEAVQTAKEATGQYKDELAEAKSKAQDYAYEVQDLENKQKQLDAEMQTAERRLEDFGAECNNAKADVNRLSIELDNVRSFARNFGQYLEDAGNKLQTVGSKMTGFGSKLSTHVTTPLVAAGTAAVKMAGDVEQSLAKVETIADTSAVSMSQIKDGIRDVSDEQGTSQKELNEAVYQWISATADTEHAIEAVNTANRLAVGGFTSTANAVDLLTTILNTYGLQMDKTEQISDELLETQNYGKTTVDQLASHLGALVPTAAQAGLSIEGLQASMAVLTRNGLQTDQAATALRAALNSMVAPSEEATKAAAVLGINWDASELKARGFAGMMAYLNEALENAEPKYAELSSQLDAVNKSIDDNNATVETNKARIEALTTANDELTQQMRALEDAGQKNTQGYKDLKRQYQDNNEEAKRLASANKTLATETKQLQKDAGSLAGDMETLSNAAESPISVFAELFGSVRGLTAALSMGSEKGLADYETALDRITHSAGATDRAFNTMQKTSVAKLNRAVNRLKNTAIDAGEKLAPIVADIVDKLADLVGKFSDLDEAEQRQILTIAGVAAAAGPVLSVTGKVTSGLGSIVSGIGSVVKSAGTVTSVAGTAAGAVGGIAGAAGEASGALGPAGLSGVLSALSTPGVGYAVVAAAAIAGIGGACVYAYNKAIDNNLAEHFGNVKLTAEEAADIAKRITETPWTVHLEAYSSAREDLEQVEKDLQLTIGEMNAAHYKINAGIKLTEDEKKQYRDDVETLQGQLQTWITDHKLATQLAITAVYGDAENGKDITQTTDAIYGGLERQLSLLGGELAALVNDAFKNDLLDDEATAELIRQKREEIQRLLNDWAEAEYDVKLRGISLDIEGGDITPDSYKQITDEIKKQYDAAAEEIDAATQEIMVPIQYEYNTSNKTDEDREKLEKGLTDTIFNATDRKGELVLKGINYSIETIEGHYDNATRESAEKFVDDMEDTFQKEIERATRGDISFDTLIGYLDSQLGDGFEGLSSKEQAAVRKLLNMMAPQEAELLRLANVYKEAGLEVPESISQGLTDINKLRALTGDVDAGYSLIADRAATSPELQRAIVTYTHTGGILPTGLMNALETQYPDIYNAAMGMDEELAQGIINGTRTVTNAAQETVDAVHNTVDGADGGTIKIRTTEQQSVIDAVRRVINSITTLLSRFKITLPIQFASTAGSVLSRILPGYSQGGIVTRAQVATVAEGNDAEAIIPLATSQRSRALELYSEVGDILGAQSGTYNLNKGGGGDDLANRIAAKIAAVLQQTPITNTVNLEMVDGDVLIDGEKAGRKLAPVVSRVQAQRR